MINGIKPEVSTKTVVDSTDDYDVAMDKFVGRIDEKIGDYYRNTLTNLTYEPIEVKSGRRFDKLTRDGSVYCFVEKNTGDVYKPATWKSPYTKGNNPVRGNIHDLSTFWDKNLYGGGWLYV
mgnify:CR=1 FL=1|tara:strand:- start:496 stop:858 length:363 start_codon:yes stop_codon:yes gene_type:complete